MIDEALPGPVQESPAQEEGEAENGARPTGRTRRTVPLADFAALLTLTVLVWGLFALDRGPWRDDVIMLAGATRAEIGSHGWADLLAPPRNMPTRRFNLLPYSAALSTEHPLAFLQLLYGATWLGTGLVSYWLARLLLPSDGRRLAFAVGALVICATGDFYSFSLGSLNYILSVLGFLLGLASALAWMRSGSLRWLPAMAVSLSFGIWQTDAAFTSLFLSPLLFWAVGGFRISRRLIIVTISWCLVCAPYLVVFMSSVLDPTAYAGAQGHVQLSLGPWLGQTVELFLHNFTPWAWSFGRPRFEWYPPTVVPSTLRWILVAVGVALFLWQWRRHSAEDSDMSSEGTTSRSRWLVVGLFLLFALAANLMYAKVQMAQLIYRTQFVSRVFVSLALAVVACSPSLGRIRLGQRPLALGTLLLTVFLGLGILGGLERQDYYLSAWWHQRRELTSLIREAPAIDSRALLVLRVPPRARGTVTFNSLLAKNWLLILYRKLDGANLAVISSRGDDCRPETSGLRCWSRRERDCISAGTCEGRLSSYDRLVVLTYSPEDGCYRLDETLPAQLRPTDDEVSGYEPRRWIRPVEIHPTSRRILSGNDLLGRLLPAAEPPLPIP